MNQSDSPKKLLTDEGFETVCQWLHSTRKTVSGAEPWDMAGVRAGLAEATQTWPTTADLLAAAFSAMADPKYRTPRMMARIDRARFGPTGAAVEVARSARRLEIACPEHPGFELVTCPQCRERRPSEPGLGPRLCREAILQVRSRGGAEPPQEAVG